MFNTKCRRPLSNTQNAILSFFSDSVNRSLQVSTLPQTFHREDRKEDLSLKDLLLLQRGTTGDFLTNKLKQWLSESTRE